MSFDAMSERTANVLGILTLAAIFLVGGIILSPIIPIIGSLVCAAGGVFLAWPLAGGLLVVNDRPAEISLNKAPTEAAVASEVQPAIDTSPVSKKGTKAKATASVEASPAPVEPRKPKTPPCPGCGGQMDIIRVGEEVVGWKCAVCSKDTPTTRRKK